MVRVRMTMWFPALLFALGELIIVAGVYRLADLGWATIALGLLLALDGLLLADVDEPKGR